MKTQKRLGCFTISRFLFENWKDLAQVMTHFVVIDARPDYARDAIDYVAFSELFDALPDAAPAPYYSIQMTNNPDGTVSVKAVRE